MFAHNVFGSWVAMESSGGAYLTPTFTRNPQYVITFAGGDEGGKYGSLALGGYFQRAVVRLWPALPLRRTNAQYHQTICAVLSHSRAFSTFQI